MEKEVKMLWEIYNEEKLRRKFIKEYKIDSEGPDGVLGGYVIEEKESFLKIKKKVKKDILCFRNDFKKIKDDQVSKIDLIKDLKNGIDKFIKNNDKNKKKLITQFEEYKKKFEMEKIWNEKKLNFLNKEKNGEKLNEIRRSLSINNIFDKDFLKDEWFFENKDMLFYYNMINRKFKKLKNFNKEIFNLKKAKTGNITNQVIDQILKRKIMMMRRKKKKICF